ncbi:putative VV A7-like early transcription factor large subunit [Namao virus]|nr:putative VV A7-like early transcription factor large subunit [Namao virus]
MDKPIKIIYKFKNNKKKIQYHLLIFVGFMIESNINKILKKIKNKDLYESLVSLTDNEIEFIRKKYGEYWYKHFFISYHINYVFNTVLVQNKSYKNAIIERYGMKWYKEHVLNYSFYKKSFLSYNAAIRSKKEKQEAELFSKAADHPLEDEDHAMQEPLAKQVKAVKGGDEPIDFDDVNDEDDSPYFYKKEPEEETIDYNFDEIDDMVALYEDDIDINASHTYENIQKILDQGSNKYKDSEIQEWDSIKDNVVYDESISNVYHKIYIYNQYIFIDDTIKTIKNKICCGLKKNPVFDTASPYFIPSRLYLWGENNYIDQDNVNKTEKLMIGKRWTLKNDVLDIDIEPHNNIHLYETTEDKLKHLQVNIKKYLSKINFTNDEYFILQEYIYYLTNNEIYMIDLYSQLGAGFGGDDQASTSTAITKDERLKNLFDIYIRVYFNEVTHEDFNSVLSYLQKTESATIEANKINSVYKTILNDLTIENEIINIIEEKKKEKDYQSCFKQNHITQSIINIDLNFKYVNSIQHEKIELYHILNNFVMNDIYLFLQYNTNDNKTFYKILDNPQTYMVENKDVLARWFENTPRGMSFKIKVNNPLLTGDENKYISVSLNENGKMDYKIQWKEKQGATIDYVIKSFEYVKDLIKKINQENINIKLQVPDDSEFKFAFINSIQQFSLPGNASVYHNDLSNFCRFFYPYVAIVIEPKKRKSKISKKNESSKYGTYLRYKRINNYENEIDLEKRILYFLRNYEFNKKLLIEEISKQFNITESDANHNIDKVIKKYPKLKKSRNVLKNIENITNYKAPGIDINIQGKTKENYKIRINGVKNNEQLVRISEFINIMIFLYYETYILKKESRQELKTKLKQLTNIAKRRNKVKEVIDLSGEEKDHKNIKNITNLDKDRLGFKPKKGQNQWTRSCQNSGNTKRRRPMVYNDNTLSLMTQSGYTYNKENNDYERMITLNIHQRPVEIMLRAIRLQDSKNNDLYFTCSPEENGKYIYVGFLSKSTNPHGLSMPCCFKKDPLKSKNQDKITYYLKATGKISSGIADDLKSEMASDKHKNPFKIQRFKTVNATKKLYILQDTDKITNNRYGFMPKILDYYFNFLLNNMIMLKNNYICMSQTGYYLKYGMSQDDNYFLHAIAASLDIAPSLIIQRVIYFLSTDENRESIFISLNNGNIKTQFKTIENYLDFIKYNVQIDYIYLCDILSIPGCIDPLGINILMFDKKNIVGKLQNVVFKDDFLILSNNFENFFDYYDPRRNTFIFLKSKDRFYPIHMLTCKNLNDNIVIQRSFGYDTEQADKNIINHILKHMKMLHFNISNIDNIQLDTAKETLQKLAGMGEPGYLPVSQIYDMRNKCVFIVTENGNLIPVKPSGCLYFLPAHNYDNYLRYTKDLYETVKYLTDIFQLSDKKIYVNPQGLCFSEYNISDDTYEIVSILIDKKLYVPVTVIKITKDDIKKLKQEYQLTLTLEKQSIYNEIDKEIFKGKDNIVIDDRIKNVNYETYRSEGYELFRLELSYYITHVNQEVGAMLEKYFFLPSRENHFKRRQIKALLFYITSDYLFKVYNETLKSTPKIKPKFIHISDDINFDHIKHHYKLCNVRETCLAKSVDENDFHCQKIETDQRYYYTVSLKFLIDYINKVTEDFLYNKIKSYEIFKHKGYYVSNVIDYNIFTEKPGQKIIKNNSINVNTILSDLFDSKVPLIGKKKINKISKNIDIENLKNYLEKVNNRYFQIIINNNAIYRAYANIFYWIKNPLLEPDHKNLGYYSIIQTDLSNLLKSYIIDWFMIKENQEILYKEIGEIIKLNINTYVKDFEDYLNKNNEVYKCNVVDLYIFSKIYQDHPILLYNNFNKIIGIFHNKIIYLENYLQTDLPSIIKNYMDFNLYFNIKYNITEFNINNAPTTISVIYY